MRLSELLLEDIFKKSFSEILKFAPETGSLRNVFYDMFNYLRALPTMVKVRTIVTAEPHFYLEEDIYYIDLCAYPHNLHFLEDFPLLAVIVKPIFPYKFLNKYFREQAPLISKERTLALLLWDLVGIKQLYNTNIYLPLNSEDKIIEIIYEVTPYNISPEKGAYRIECTLDDYMWHEEKKTVVYLSYSDGYEEEIEKIRSFINNMMREPTIILGKNQIQGIAMKCVFISDKCTDVAT